MKFVKRILFFISLFFLYVIVKEFLLLHQSLYTIHPYLGHAFLVLILGVVVYFVIIPVLQLLRLPRHAPPTKNPNKIEDLIQKRMKRFRKNPYLKDLDLPLATLPDDVDGYEQIVHALEAETEKIRKKYVTQVFYSTAVAQNGFLDALLILIISVNLIREIFWLYQGRLGGRDLFTVVRMVYFSMAIGGSEGVEYATDEILANFSSSGMKGIPFASKVVGSLADGFVNAALLTRISYITENYCKVLHIQNEKELYPSYKTVVSTTRIITFDIAERIIQEVKQVAKENSNRLMDLTVNPASYLIGKAVGRMQDVAESVSVSPKAFIQETTRLIYHPFSFVFQKIGQVFSRK